MGLDFDRFQEQINKLRAYYPHLRIDDAAVPYWFDELDKHNFTDDEVDDGMCFLVLDKNIRFPGLADLIEACRRSRRERIEQEHRNRKHERAKSPEELLAEGGKRSTFVRELAGVTKMFVAGKMGDGREAREVWVKKCRDVYRKHGCRFPEEVLGGRIRRYYAEVLKNQEEKT